MHCVLSSALGLAILAGVTAPTMANDVTKRLSIASNNAQANGDSGLNGAAISADGRFVAYDSFATNLIPKDTNGRPDVFVRDRQKQTTERVSPGEIQYNGQSGGPAISADGRFVAFWSEGSNLATNGQRHILVHDRKTSKSELVSVGPAGVEGNLSSDQAAISADGRFVTFTSAASNLVPGDTNGRWDVFVRDRLMRTTTRVSVGPKGAQGNADSNHTGLPAISADGRFVAFWSYATNLVRDDTNGVVDVFVHDRKTGVTERGSIGRAGVQPNDASFVSKLSANGRFLAFWSFASNLVPSDTNGARDTFVRDRKTGMVERVSVGPRGRQSDGDSGLFDVVSISADGRFVVFDSDATNLVPGDTNGTTDIFVRDRLLNNTRRVSVGPGGLQANDRSFQGDISTDGCLVIFTSRAANLVRNDTNGATDVFIRAR